MAAYKPVITRANRIILAIGFAYGAVVIGSLLYMVVNYFVASKKDREQFKARMSEGVPFVDIVYRFKAKHGAWPESSSDASKVAGESLPKGWTYIGEVKDTAGNIYPPVLQLRRSSRLGRMSLEYEFGNSPGWYFNEGGTRTPMEIGKSRPVAGEETTNCPRTPNHLLGPMKNVPARGKYRSLGSPKKLRPLTTVKNPSPQPLSPEYRGEGSCCDGCRSLSGFYSSPTPDPYFFFIAHC